MTIYAHIVDGEIEAVGAIPPDTDYVEGRHWDLREETREPGALAACGWVEVITTPRPADTDTATHSDSWVLEDGVVKQVWAQRPKSDAELAMEAAQASRQAARAAVKAIVVDLQAEKARVDPVIAKTNAQITGADTKDVARAAKRIADAAIDLARFVQDLA